MALVFDSSFTPQYGEPVELGKGILRLTVNNPSAFTFHGTNSYIIGTDTLAVIDPGPDNDAHYNALIAAIAGRPVSHIFVSHTHRDHSPLAQRLKESLGARTVAEGAHRPARPYYAGEVNMLEASADTDFIPDIALADGGTIEGDGWTLEGIHTPGHAANHMAFGLKNTGVLFSADHVMAWATSIVAPPDGSMSDYMVSLEKNCWHAMTRSICRAMAGPSPSLLLSFAACVRIARCANGPSSSASCKATGRSATW